MTQHGILGVAVIGAGTMGADHIRRLGWHALAHAGELAFPGDQLFRLSLDLGTGSAGTLLALAAASGRPTARLPFLAPRAGAV